MKFKPLVYIKISLMFIVVLFYGVVVFSGYLAVQSLFFEGFLFPAIITGFLFFFTLAAALWLTLPLYALHKMELVIGPTALELRSIQGAGKFLEKMYRPFTVDYKSIAQIAYEANGVTWKITDMDGRFMWLAPHFFEKRDTENILTELRAHVSEQCFEEGFFTLKLERKKRIKIKTGVMLVLLTLQFFFTLSDSNLYFRPLLFNAWEVEEKVPAFENLRSSYSTSDGSLWLLSKKFPSDHYSVYYRGVDGTDRKFELPDFEIPYSSVISADEVGRPIIWMEDRVMYYTNAWQIIPYANNFEIDFFRSNKIVIDGDKAWAIVLIENSTHLIHISSQTGEWFDIPKPESALRDDLSFRQIHQLSHNEFLVLMSGEDVYTVYLFSQGSWQKQEFPLPDKTDFFTLQDFSLDLNGSLFLLIQDQSGWSVQRISPSGVVDTTQLPVVISDEPYIHYMQIKVDALGRLWINENYSFISAFKPEWGGIAQILQVYTEDNSNFQADSYQSIVLLPDGTLLSTGDYVSSIDTDLAILPSPLAEWYVKINDLPIPLVIQLLVLAFIFLEYGSHRKNIKKGVDKFQTT